MGTTKNCLVTLPGRLTLPSKVAHGICLDGHPTVSVHVIYNYFCLGKINVRSFNDLACLGNYTEEHDKIICKSLRHILAGKDTTLL